MIKILIIAVNPKNTLRLRLDEEIREISEGLRRSKYSKNFVINQQWAVRLKDIRRAMLDHEPHIVHFCGHGEKNGLVVENDNGNMIIVNPEALSELFSLFKGKIKCVLLNACYSAIHAKIITQYIDYVIGIKKGVQDNIAIEFVTGFYDALGAGESIEAAFSFAENATKFYDVSESLLPIFMKREDLGRKTRVEERVLENNCIMDDAFRLRQQIDELKQQWSLLSRKLSELENDKILETRREEKMRLERLTNEIRNERQHVAKELKRLEQSHL